MRLHIDYSRYDKLFYLKELCCVLTGLISTGYIPVCQGEVETVLETLVLAKYAFRWNKMLIQQSAMRCGIYLTPQFHISHEDMYEVKLSGI